MKALGITEDKIKKRKDITRQPFIMGVSIGECRARKSYISESGQCMLQWDIW